MIKNLEGETWKNVGVFKSIDFTGYYEVSNKCAILYTEINQRKRGFNNEVLYRIL